MYIILVAFVVLLLLGLEFQIYRKCWDKNLLANAFFARNEVIAGEKAELTETIENGKALPLPMVKMKLQLSKKLLFADAENSKVSDFFNRTDIYNIGGRQKITRTIRFSCPERGYYDFNGVDVIGSDILLTKEFVKSTTSSSYMYVYPKPYDISLLDVVMQHINGEVLVKRNIYEDPFELRGIREYQTYDSMKNINWKASAKTDELMVNMHDYTAKRTIRFFLNVENPGLLKHDELSELCISILTSMIEYYAKAAVPMVVYANACDCLTGEPVYLSEGSGEAFMREANRKLARIDLRKTPESFVKLYSNQLLRADSNVYTIVLSPYMHEDFQNMLEEADSLGIGFLWVVPRYKESKMSVNDNLKAKTIELEAQEALYEASTL